jgi:hypothetical protein
MLVAVSMHYYPTVEANQQFKKDKADLEKLRVVRNNLNQSCMDRLMKTISPEFQEDIRGRDADFTLFSANYQIFSFCLCVRAALNKGAANYTIALIKSIVSPSFPIDSSVSLTHSAQIIKDNADQLRLQFPVDATVKSVIEGFTIAGLLGTFDPVVFEDFLSNCNRENPTGLGPSLADTLSSIISYVETMTPATVAYKKQQSDVFRAATQEQELYGLISKVIAGPQGPQNLVASITKHPHKAKIVALLTAKSSGSTPAPSKPTPTGTLLPAIPCPICKKTFTPLETFHKLCNECNIKARKAKAAAAIVDDSVPTDTSALTAILSLAADQTSRSSILSSVTPIHPPGYWDNGSSVHTTCDFSNILNVTPLASPFWIGGVGSGIQAASTLTC